MRCLLPGLLQPAGWLFFVSSRILFSRVPSVQLKSNGAESCFSTDAQYIFRGDLPVRAGADQVTRRSRDRARLCALLERSLVSAGSGWSVCFLGGWLCFVRFFFLSDFSIRLYLFPFFPNVPNRSQDLRFFSIRFDDLYQETVAGALTSNTAFSVSTSHTNSPFLTASPSFLSQRTTVPNFKSCPP